jgi:uncharacterized membrane protein YebE (DUF533 family)
MFDTKGFLNEMLGQAKTLAGQGEKLITDKLGGGATGTNADGTPNKDGLMKGLGAGAIGGVVLGLLMGTKGGRSLGGGALKLGSLAALGTVAYKAYQSYTAKKAGTAAPVTAALAAPEGTSLDADILLRGMIGAAKADGHIDAAERTAIIAELGKLGLANEATAMIDMELKSTSTIADLASAVKNEHQAAELYALSAAVVGEQSAAERSYLADLAKALNIPAELAAEIESELTA